MSDADCTPSREPRSVAASFTFIFTVEMRQHTAHGLYCELCVFDNVGLVIHYAV